MGNGLTQAGVKRLRARLQEIVDELKMFSGKSRESSLAITKIQEGKMWLGQELGNIGGEDLNAKRDKEELRTAEQDEEIA